MSSRLAYPLTSPTPSRTTSLRRPTSIEAARLALRKTERQTRPELIFVPQLIDARAAETPDAPALSTGAEVLTYGELNRRANQLAHYLISLGVGRNTEVGADNLVGICLERSLTGVVSALAVLKAGAAYLPLDPAYPIERLAFMFNDAQPQVLITNASMAKQLPAGAWKVIAIDQLAEIEQTLPAMSE